MSEQCNGLPETYITPASDRYPNAGRSPVHGPSFENYSEWRHNLAQRQLGLADKVVEKPQSLLELEKLLGGHTLEELETLYESTEEIEQPRESLMRLSNCKNIVNRWLIEGVQTLYRENGREISVGTAKEIAQRAASRAKAELNYVRSVIKAPDALDYIDDIKNAHTPGKWIEVRFRQENGDYFFNKNNRAHATIMMDAWRDQLLHTMRESNQFEQFEAFQTLLTEFMWDNKAGDLIPVFVKSRHEKNTFKVDRSDPNKVEIHTVRPNNEPWTVITELQRRLIIEDGTNRRIAVMQRIATKSAHSAGLKAMREDTSILETITDLTRVEWIIEDPADAEVVMNRFQRTVELAGGTCIERRHKANNTTNGESKKLDPGQSADYRSNKSVWDISGVPGVDDLTIEVKITALEDYINGEYALGQAHDAYEIERIVQPISKKTIRPDGSEYTLQLPCSPVGLFFPELSERKINELKARALYMAYSAKLNGEVQEVFPNGWRDLLPVPTVRIGVRRINPETNQIELLFLRKDQALRDNLEIPGGKVENGASNTDAAIEELCQETGIQVRPDELILIGEHIYARANGRYIHRVVATFMVDIGKSNPDFIINQTLKKDGSPEDNHAEIFWANYQLAIQLYAERRLSGNTRPDYLRRIYYRN